jgi:hypothetical protein
MIGFAVVDGLLTWHHDLQNLLLSIYGGSAAVTAVLHCSNFQLETVPISTQHVYSARGNLCPQSYTLCASGRQCNCYTEAHGSTRVDR